MPPSPSEILAECAANPDDDAPRLVWADLVGGERGELVVIQCDLARGGLSPSEAGQRRRRERELLEAHGVEWAGSLVKMATRWSFRRGFIETARFEPLAFDAKQLDDFPLLSTIVVDAWPSGLVTIERLAESIRPLRGLALQGSYMSEHDPGLIAGLDLAVFHGLRALEISGGISGAAVAVRNLVSKAPIEQLWLSDHRLDDAQLEELFSAAPKLSAIAIDPLPVVPAQPLRAVRTASVSLKALRRSSADTLEHLACDFAAVGKNVEWLADFHALRTLDIRGVAAEPIVDKLVRTPGFAALRTLRVQPALREAQVRAIVDRFGAQLERLTVPTGTYVAGVTIAGELRSADGAQPPYAKELLHHEPATMFTLGAPCFAKSEPACVARLAPDGPIWDVPVGPAEERVMIGRAIDSFIHLSSPMVARRHAALCWRGERHELRDCGSDNGTYIDDLRIDRAPLVDGAEFSVSNIRMQYFTGDGARARAEAAIARQR